jgi:hypothetical protein
MLVYPSRAREDGGPPDQKVGTMDCSDFVFSSRNRHSSGKASVQLRSKLSR